VTGGDVCDDDRLVPRQAIAFAVLPRLKSKCQLRSTKRDGHDAQVSSEPVAALAIEPWSTAMRMSVTDVVTKDYALQRRLKKLSVL
jgi:hypothetical protein